MAVSQGYQAFILDLLMPIQPIARRMFGGVGLFQNGVMFGLLAQDALYFRVSDGTRQRYEDAGSAPFSYMRGDHAVSIEAYYQVPEDLMDRPDALVQWAREAIQAAPAPRIPGKRRTSITGKKQDGPRKSRHRTKGA